MTRSLRIARLAPTLLGLNGSTGNAEVLSRRAAWWGVTVDMVDLVDDPGGSQQPDIIVLGHATSSSLGPLSVVLDTWRDTLRDWHASGTCLLGVGLGGDALGQSLTLDATSPIYEGVGITPVVTMLSGTRFSGEVVGQDPQGRTVAGYLNDQATRRGSAVTGFITVDHPAGSTWTGYTGNRSDGVVAPGVWVTTLSGPVCALNPFLADDIVAACGAARDWSLPEPTPQHLEADQRAEAARAAIISRVTTRR